MKLPQTILFLLTFLTAIHALTLPSAFQSFAESSTSLFKRKGGGHGGGKGGGSSGGGDSGGGSSGGSSGGGSKGGSGGGSTSTGSNSGGRSSGGSGVAPAYGGGQYYGGGASVPYRSGGISPLGISPFFIGGAALVALPFIIADSNYYNYHYPGSYTYHNNTNNQNETYPVDCVCQDTLECGCDNNNNTDYINSVANNASTAGVTDVNGTQTLVIDGTLANGTTASGGTSGASALTRSLAEMSGWWFVVAGVVYTVWFM